MLDYDNSNFVTGQVNDETYWQGLTGTSNTSLVQECDLTALQSMDFTS